jgi:hypothetical protein
MTVTSSIGTRDKHDKNVVDPATSHGVASVGVYQVVPWSAYHFPAKPAGPQSIPDMATDLPHVLTTLTATTTTTTIMLPSQIEMTAATAEPGMIDVFLNGIKIGECNTYGYGDGCSGGTQTVGKGRLAGFTISQKATLSVIVQHFPNPQDWEVQLWGP